MGTLGGIRILEIGRFSVFRAREDLQGPILPQLIT